MKIAMIAAIGKNNELGKKNQLLWHLPNDLKFFKEVTLNHTVLMGLNTYKSIGRPLPKRRNIVLSYNGEYQEDGIEVYGTIDEALKNLDEDKIFVIGGASMYTQFIDRADELYLTEVDAEDREADAYFPQFDKSRYNYTKLKDNSDGNISYCHVLYTKK
ncbi:MAG: dihydrofolate reductase [Erysipelotrichaceae bacterium]|nr:dihydrofolate reductase [Erysipelotrichaceae bacterium]